MRHIWAVDSLERRAQSTASQQSMRVCANIRVAKVVKAKHNGAAARLPARASIWINNLRHFILLYL